MLKDMIHRTGMMRLCMGSNNTTFIELVSRLTSRVAQELASCGGSVQEAVALSPQSMQAQHQHTQ